MKIMIVVVTAVTLGDTSPPEPLYEETMNDGEFSSDMDV